MSISVSREHFKLPTILNTEHSNIKRTPTQIINHDVLLLVTHLLDAVSQRCCSRLIEDADYFETRDSACVFCSSTLGVVEVGGDSDDTFVY